MLSAKSYDFASRVGNSRRRSKSSSCAAHLAFMLQLCDLDEFDRAKRGRLRGLESCAVPQLQNARLLGQDAQRHRIHRQFLHRFRLDNNRIG